MILASLILCFEVSDKHGFSLKCSLPSHTLIHLPFKHKIKLQGRKLAEFACNMIDRQVKMHPFTNWLITDGPNHLLFFLFTNPGVPGYFIRWCTAMWIVFKYYLKITDPTFNLTPHDWYCWYWTVIDKHSLAGQFPGCK